jgi:alkylation response protein AidB-like acyl-CoA dehydrogenase
MTPYSAPVRDMQFVLQEMGILEHLSQLPGCEEVTPDLTEAILEEAGKFAAEQLAPLNHSGDVEGAAIDNGVVRTPKGFADAYKAFVEGGWNAVPFEPEHGGQGLPWTLATAVTEMWHSANMSWALCPLLTQGAVEALQVHGSPEQQAAYLPKLISGEWSGTMNLTEPQAGSDLSLIRTRAERKDGHYLIRGTKIYITYGEHDMAENIVHLVLARCEDAPEGTRGISLFIVPKFLPKSDGSPGERNDLRCVSLEHKLGIMGSPTCVMSYGDHDGAVGYLVGEENRGLEYMFTMMNNARLAVGLQGLSIVERAYQHARSFARDRKQGRAGDKKLAPIVEHADVRRMLMTMRANAEAMRAVVLETMLALDQEKRHPDETLRAWAGRRVGLMTPVVKGWFTDLGVEMSSLNIQIHGGMGFVEETGAAQFYRDSRILPIYEGTNGIQAMDLVGRKLLRDDGTAARELMDELHVLINGLNPIDDPDIAAIRKRLAKAVDTVEDAVDWLLEHGKAEPDAAGGTAAYFLRALGTTAGGAALARAARAALDRLESDSDAHADFLKAKIATARFYADNILTQVPGLVISMESGWQTLRTIPDEAL